MLTHDFGQIKSSFEKGLNMMFADVLDKREVFLDYKNVTIRCRNICIFLRAESTHDFGQKVGISSEFVSLSKRPWYDVDDALYREV